MGLTFDKLEELEELSKAHEAQWSRMEVALDKAMVSVEDGSVFTELDELMTATGRAIGDILETFERFIKENLVQVSDAGVSPAGATPSIVPAEEKAEIAAVEYVREEDVCRSQFDENASENAEQDVKEASVGATLGKRPLLAGSCPGVI